MSAFSGLKLVAAKRPQTAAPAVVRRAKLAGQLAEQMELVRANAAGTTYAPMRVRSVLDKATGLRSSVQHAKRVKQWWFMADTGRVCLQVRYGTRVLELARACAAGTTYAPMRVRSVLDKATGLRSSVQHAKRVRQWWWLVPETGRVCLQVFYGTRILDLAKGKNSIDVGSSAELLTVLETVKKCVELGELDAQIDAASAAVRARFVK